MRFALLGDHADGLEMARALANSGRHELGVYSGPAVGMEYLQRFGLSPARQGDLEAVLANPQIEAVIVAGPPALRPAQLRRALQSERHVLCVCPVDDSPDVAYEAAMIQEETGFVLFPLLPEAIHPGFRRLAELARGAAPVFKKPVLEAVTPLHHDNIAPATLQLPVSPEPQLRAARLLEVERWSTDEVLLESEELGHHPGFPGWDVLRLIGGDIREIMALSGPEECQPGEPILLSGVFDRGGLFQAAYVPLQAEGRLRFVLVNAIGRAELLFGQGWPGPAQLTYTDDDGHAHEERWEALNPWPALVDAFEEACRSRLPPFAGLSWHDAIRGLELDDAARRSLQKRRASTLEFQEVTEEATFKGTMTLVGCSVLWISLLLLIFSLWLPWLGWIILPVIVLFLGSQMLRWVVPEKSKRP